MIDQTTRVLRNAAELIAAQLPDVPGGMAGDMRLDPEKLEAAWYVLAEAKTPPQLRRQTVKLSVIARSAVRLDKDRSRVDALAERLEAVATGERFADALAGSCAVLPVGGAVYGVDESFHTVTREFNIFIMEV